MAAISSLPTVSTFITTLAKKELEADQIKSESLQKAEKLTLSFMREKCNFLSDDFEMFNQSKLPLKVSFAFYTKNFAFLLKAQALLSLYGTPTTGEQSLVYIADFANDSVPVCVKIAMRLISEAFAISKNLSLEILMSKSTFIHLPLPIPEASIIFLSPLPPSEVFTLSPHLGFAEFSSERLKSGVEIFKKQQAAGKRPLPFLKIESESGVLHSLLVEDMSELASISLGLETFCKKSAED